MVKALVVEDEEDIRNLLVEQLLDKGCQVRKADNGAIALQRVKEEIPDIIFVDIVMPVMDGILFVSELSCFTVDHTSSANSFMILSLSDSTTVS